MCVVYLFNITLCPKLSLSVQNCPLYYIVPYPKLSSLYAKLSICPKLSHICPILSFVQNYPLFIPCPLSVLSCPLSQPVLQASIHISHNHGFCSFFFKLISLLLLWPRPLPRCIPSAPPSAPPVRSLWCELPRKEGRRRRLCRKLSRAHLQPFQSPPRPPNPAAARIQLIDIHENNESCSN